MRMNLVVISVVTIGREANKLKIVPFSERYRDPFIQFNKDWILDNFGFLEQEDLDTFEKIEDELKSGAMIFIAVDEQEEAVACCMTRPLSDGRWELCKFASNKNRSHKGAGCAVFEATINYAISHGAAELFLLSNSKLKTAMHIYQKYGFHEIKLDNYEYERGNIAFLRTVKGESDNEE
mgnify:CR=1 FL=1